MQIFRIIIQLGIEPLSIFKITVTLVHLQQIEKWTAINTFGPYKKTRRPRFHLEHAHLPKGRFSHTGA